MMGTTYLETIQTEKMKAILRTPTKSLSIVCQSNFAPEYEINLFSVEINLFCIRISALVPISKVSAPKLAHYATPACLFSVKPKHLA